MQENTLTSLVLVKPTIDMAQDIQEYKDEVLSVDPEMNGDGGLDHFNSVESWIEYAKKHDEEFVFSDGTVRATTLFSLDKSRDRLIGMIDIRHELNDYLFKFGGNIGYSIRPSERHKGYGKQQLLLGLDYAKSVIGLKRVLITCVNTNEASRKTILACGGKFENELYDSSDNTIMQRYWIEL